MDIRRTEVKDYGIYCKYLHTFINLLIYLYIYFVCVYVCLHVHVCGCNGAHVLVTEQLLGAGSLTVWVPGLNLGLVTSTLTH